MLRTKKSRMILAAIILAVLFCLISFIPDPYIRQVLYGMYTFVAGVGALWGIAEGIRWCVEYIADGA